MPSKRPTASRASSSSSSIRSIKRLREDSLFSDLNVFIVDAKMDHKIPDLVDKIEGELSFRCYSAPNHGKTEHVLQYIPAYGGQVTDVSSCDVILTSLHSPARLKLHVPAHYIGTGDGNRPVEIVSPQWIYDSIALDIKQPFENYRMLEAIPTSPRSTETPPALKKEEEENAAAATPPSKQAAQPQDVESERPSFPAYDPSTSLSCKKLIPLVSPNEDIARLLRTVSNSRRLEGDERSSLSYAIAVAVIKAVPHRLKYGEARKLAGVGPKIGNMVDVYLETGKITAAGAWRRS
jgi:hypothetical protein